jgi:recombinational DNA repair ATPase RecF
MSVVPPKKVFDYLPPKIKEHVEKAKWAEQANTIARDRFPPLLRSLTKQQKLASEDLLNQDFERFFRAECEALRAPKVRLQFPGRGGETARRKSIVADHRLSDVLSEGEQKVIAMSDFLAEASIRTGSSPLLFDDPVNSLDYRRLEYIV